MRIRKLALCALCAAILCLCSWICIPAGSIVLTLQSFGVFFVLMILDGHYGTLAICVYLLLGAVGLPVFSLGQGGLGHLLGPTGGYLFGFLVAGCVYQLSRQLWKNPLLSVVLGQLFCYLCGTVWFSALYGSGQSIGALLLACVVPYLLPDALKLLLAYVLARRLKPLLRA